MGSSSSANAPEGSGLLNPHWYSNNLPPDSNPSRATFLLGLTASPGPSTNTLNDIFINFCISHHIWERPHPYKFKHISDTVPFYNTTAAISQVVCEKYPSAPQRWVEHWVRALVMESYGHPGMPFFSDVDNTDQPSIHEQDSYFQHRKSTTPLHQMTFILAVHPTATTTACILEVVSSRCLDRSHFGDHPAQYQLSLFQEAFQSVLREKMSGREVDVCRGRLQWIRNGMLETIENQHDFEVAVTQLYNERKTGWELFFLLVQDENGDGVGGNEMGLEEQIVEKSEVIEQSTYVTQYKGKEKEKDSSYEGIENRDNMQRTESMSKGKGKEKASEPEHPQQSTYAQPEASTYKGKSKEKTIDYEEAQQLTSKQLDISSYEGKGKEEASDYELLKPTVYSQPEAAWFRRGERKRGNEVSSHHDETKQLTYAQRGTSASEGKERGNGKGDEETSDHARAEPSTSQTTASRSHQSPESSQGVPNVEQVDKMGTQIEHTITKALGWGRDADQAMRRAQQRVKEAKKKEKEKQAEAQPQRIPSRSTTDTRKVSTAATMRSSASKQSTSTTSSICTESNRNSGIARKALLTQGKQVSSSSNASSSSNPDRNNQAQAGNVTLLSTSSGALPYEMTDKERREKIMRVRRQFPGQEMPAWRDTEHALLETGGNVDGAFVKLGGKLKKNIVTGTPRRAPLIPLRSTSLLAPATNVGVSERSIGSDSMGEESSSKAPATQQRTESKKSTDPGAVLPTPPSTGPKDKRTRLGFHQRLQNATHAAGKHITLSNIGTPKQEKHKSGSALPTPRSPGLRSMLGAFKSRGQVSLVPPEAENKYYEFYVTKERVYKSGGDDEDAINPLVGYVKSDEDMDPDDENEEGERSEKKPKNVMGLLKDLQNFKGLAQLTDPDGEESDMTRWLDCCRLFQIDPSETGMRERMHIVGIKQPLFQYQAFSVYWQMLNSRRFGGGIVADMPGLGKTLIFLSLIVVERQLCILWDDVNQSRRVKDGRHLPLSKQLMDDVCPSQSDRPGWIACPCVFSNPTSQMPPQPGVRIAIVSGSLMSNWRAEWEKNIDAARTDLDMRLLLAHKWSVADRAEMSQMADYHANISGLRASKVDRGPDTAKANQERFLVLTTAQSYDAWIENFKYGGPRSLVMVLEQSILRKKYVWTTGFKYNIQFGIACADESHEEYHIEKGRSGVLARLPGNPMCWGYSGTPLDKSPRCLEGILWAIEKQAKKIDMESLTTGWGQNKDMKDFRREVFDKICKEFELGVKSGTTNADTLNSLRIQLLSFLSTFMIRRTPESRWFGHPLVTLNANLHRDVFLMHNSRFDEDIKSLTPEIEADAVDRLRLVQAMWDRAPETRRSLERPRVLGFNNNIHTQYKLRILATCPALIKLTTGENALTLKTDELKKWRGNNEKNSPYAKNLPKIFENSPKLMWLRECILDLENQRDVERSEQKMVIITNFSCIALIVKLMIEHYIPFKKGRVGLMHAEMSTAAQTAILEGFTDAMIDDKHGTAVRKRKENIQFLIGTTPMLSKGLQLTRACNVILMEPDHEFYRELQGYARVNRIGQRNPWTFSYRLIDDQSEVEKSILQRQKERGEFPGRVLKAGDVERMGPRDNGASIDEPEDLEQTVSWAAPKKMLTRLEPTLRRKKGVSDLRGRALLGGQGISV